MINANFFLFFTLAIIFLLVAENSRRQFFRHQAPAKKEDSSRLAGYYVYHSFKGNIIVCDFFGGFLLFGLFGFYIKNLIAYSLSKLALASYAENIAVFIVAILLIFYAVKFRKTKFIFIGMLAFLICEIIAPGVFGYLAFK